MKLIVELVHINQMKQYQHVDAWLIGVKGLSKSVPHHFTKGEIIELIKRAKANDQKIMINAGKMFNDLELTQAQGILVDLKDLAIAGYFYTDLGFYEMASKQGLPLIYQASTYLTNTQDINLALEENESIVVAGEINYNELLKILNNVKRSVMVEGFGTWAIFHSRRRLLSNYALHHGVELLKDALYHLIEEQRTECYPIEEDDQGTQIYFPGFYYLADEIKNLMNVSHLILRMKFVPHDLIDQVIAVYDKLLSGQAVRIDDLGLPLTKAALNKNLVLKKENITNEEN